MFLGMNAGSGPVTELVCVTGWTGSVCLLERCVDEHGLVFSAEGGNKKKKKKEKKKKKKKKKKGCIRGLIDALSKSIIDYSNSGGASDMNLHAPPVRRFHLLLMKIDYQNMR
jgi:hypothetical protein